MKINSTLFKVGLDDNPIGSKGCTELAGAPKVDTSVGDVNIFGNCIDDEGCAALAEALEANNMPRQQRI